MKMLVLSAPSGSGKTTLVRRLMADFPDLAFSVSATSRAPRGQEQDGKDYHFISVEAFKHRIENGDFLEWEEVYAGTFYGSLRSEVDRINSEGKTAVFDIDVAGGLRLKKKYPENTLAVFIQAPSLEVLEARLRGRGPDSEEKIAMRLGKAEQEMVTAGRFDHILVNDNLDRAYGELHSWVQPFLEG
jgi:guanylate kinase